MTDYILNRPVLEEWRRTNNVGGALEAHLAIACEVHPATITRWLKGATTLPYSAVKAIQKLTGIPEAQLAVPRPTGLTA